MGKLPVALFAPDSYRDPACRDRFVAVLAYCRFGQDRSGNTTHNHPQRTLTEKPNHSWLLFAMPPIKLNSNILLNL